MGRRRERTGLVDDLLAIGARLPWWANLALAVISYVAMHLVASQPPGTVTTTEELGEFAARGLFRTLASFGQYLLPLIFIIGAVVSALARRHGLRLVDQVAAGNAPTVLNDMTWQEFESLIEEAFRLQGYSVRRVGGDGPDVGVDLVLDRGAERALVQCKQWRALKVGVNVVRELYGVMAAKGAAAGIVVTSGQFTSDAIEFAGGRNVRLIEGDELFGLIRKAKAAQASAGQPTATIRQPVGTVVPPGCPQCGRAMVRRTAKRGASVGKAFWGCGGYPTCRAVVPID